MNVYRVTPNDYLRSGYDRGHLCSSADREASPEINSVTFLMTNMVPQLHELNAGPWEKLGEHERDLAGEPRAKVYIAAGPVSDLNPPKIGHGVAVPRATWKVILALKSGQTADGVTDSTEVISVVVPNEPGVGQHPWSDYRTSVAEVEKETGYDLLSKVPDQIERVIESRIR